MSVNYYLIEGPLQQVMGPAPLDSRAVISREEELLIDVTHPYVGQLIYCTDTDTYFKVTGVSPNGAHVAAYTEIDLTKEKLLKAYPFNDSTISFSDASLPLSLISPGGRVYSIEAGTMTEEYGIFTIDMTAYRAYENASSGAQDTWTLQYIGESLYNSGSSSSGGDSSSAGYSSSESSESGHSGCYISGATLVPYSCFQVRDPCTLEYTRIDEHCCVQVLAGGVTNYLEVRADTAQLVVNNSGLANNTTIISGALDIYENGQIKNYTAIASNTLLQGKGEMRVHNGGYANTIHASSGWLSIYGKGSADNISATGPSYIQVLQGGVASSLTASGGMIEVYSSGVINSCTADSCDISINRFGKIVNATLRESELRVYAQGSASNITLDSGSNMYVEVSDITSITVNPGANMYVSMGAGSIIEAGGNVVLYANANVTFSNNTFSGVLSSKRTTIHSGTTANSVTLTGGGYAYVYIGGTANNTTLSSGYLYVYNGGIIRSSVINSGSISVSSGGSAIATDVSDLMVVYINGLAVSTNVKNSGGLSVHGGFADHVTVSSGGFLGVYSSGVASNVLVLEGGITETGQGGEIHYVS